MKPKVRRVVFKTRYSGPASRLFWSNVNSVKGDAAWELMYALGCGLQDLEGRVLFELNRLPRGKSREPAMRKLATMLAPRRKGSR